MRSRIRALIEAAPTREPKQRREFCRCETCLDCQRRAAHSEYVREWRIRAIAPPQDPDRDLKGVYADAIHHPSIRHYGEIGLPPGLIIGLQRQSKQKRREY